MAPPRHGQIVLLLLSHRGPVSKPEARTLVPTVVVARYLLLPIEACHCTASTMLTPAAVPVRGGLAPGLWRRRRLPWRQHGDGAAPSCGRVVVGCAAGTPVCLAAAVHVLQVAVLRVWYNYDPYGSLPRETVRLAPVSRPAPSHRADGGGHEALARSALLLVLVLRAKVAAERVRGLASLLRMMI